MALVLPFVAAPAAIATAQDLPAPVLSISIEAQNARDLTAGGSLPVVAAAPSRPAALVPLYVSFAAMQVMDTHSTRRALAAGAVEANPLMRGVASNTVGLLAVKVAGTAAVLAVSERIWKRNKAAAVLFMAASNSAMLWVVQHNYRAIR